MSRQLDDATLRDRQNAAITRTTESRRRSAHAEDKRIHAELRRSARETEQYHTQALAGDEQALVHYVNRSFSQADAARALGISVEELRRRFSAAVTERKFYISSSDI